MTFFFDRSIGRRVPDALKLLGADVVKHDDLFHQQAPDDQWLTAAARYGWTVITKDKRIRFNEAECRAIRDARVGCFVLLSPTLSRWTMAGPTGGDHRARASPHRLRRARRWIR